MIDYIKYGRMVLFSFKFDALKSGIKTCCTGIFCAQSESSSFRVTFVTSYSNMFTAKHFARLIAILIFTCSCRRISLDRKVPLKREP